MTKPAVFVSSSSEGLAAARELSRQLESSAAVTLWPEGAFHAGQSAVESLTEVANRSDFAVFVLTSEDAEGSPNPPTVRPFARSNVAFELGLFVGRLGLSRIFIVMDAAKRVQVPSDLAGTMNIFLSMRNAPDLEFAVAPVARAIRRAMDETDIRRQDSPTEFYSCFISYSRSDQDFAERLHTDLSNVGVRSWLDVKDIEVGANWRDAIGKAIQAHDKVLLVLSRASLQSQWVSIEIRNCLRLEQDRRKTVLFPIRLDDSVFNVPNPEISNLRDKQIADFHNWKNKSDYRRVFSQLVRSLAISASVESRAQ
jgi:hypothetical protein